MKEKFTRYILSLVFFSLITVFHVEAQSSGVSGKVLDQVTGEPLIGVNVMVEGTTRGVVTDLEGNYSIQEIVQTNKLVFSFLGYVTQTIAVENQSQINISMAPDTKQLDEVVVVGYGTSSRRNLTTAVTSVGQDAIGDKPFVNVEQAIQGKAAGVQVTLPSGRPGAPLSVRVRGTTSITGGNEPLYVVDGVPVINTEGLNPNDIASIDVLKDASAAAIYGARAANGVVMITTKRGEKGKPSINFSSYVGMDEVINTLPVLNNSQFMSVLNESRENAGTGSVVDPYEGRHDTNWQNELFSRATIQNYQLSLSGGTTDNSFFVSAGYQSQEGVIAPSGFERFSLRFNQDRNISERMKFGHSIGLSRTNFRLINDNARANNDGAVLSALSAPPISPVQLENGFYPMNPFQAWDNPIALTRGIDNSSYSNKVVANMYLMYELPFDLNFKSSVGIDYTNSESNRFQDPFTTGGGRGTNGEGNNSTNTEMIWLWENVLDYEKSFGKHNLNLTAGNTAQKSLWHNTYMTGRNFPNASIPTLNAASELMNLGTQRAEWALASYFLRTNYNFDGKYLFSGTVRTDGSSRFGAGNKFGFFPSVSGGWIVSEEGFMEDVNAIESLKLRYSVGLTGNQNIGNYTSFGTYGLGSNYPFGGSIFPGVFPNQVENVDLKWETTMQHNFGIDLAVLDGNLVLFADAYYKRTSDMLFFTQIPNTTGYTGAMQNIGAMENKGIELGLQGLVLRRGNFEWNINSNISWNRNKILDLGGEVVFAGSVPDQGNTTILREGESIGTFYGWVSEGIDPATGNVIFADLNGDGVINDEDRTIIGNAIPDYIWGITNSFSYKGFDLTVFFQGVQGQDVYNATRYEMEGMSSFKNQSTSVLNRWTPENTNGSLPRAVFGDPENNNRVSDRWVEDGSFIRLRELTLGYNLPQHLSQRIGSQNVRAYIQGRNLLTFTKYSGFDPEVSRDGGNPGSLNIDYGTFPQVRSFLIGLNFSF